MLEARRIYGANGEFEFEIIFTVADEKHFQLVVWGRPYHLLIFPAEIITILLLIEFIMCQILL